MKAEKSSVRRRVSFLIFADLFIVIVTFVYLTSSVARLSLFSIFLAVTSVILVYAKRPVLTGFLMFAILIGAIVIFVRAIGPVAMDDETVRVEATKLIDSAGGPGKVCDEASQIFKHFGILAAVELHPEQLEDYPAMAVVGKKQGIIILPGIPPTIQIQVGTHRKGYVIVIVDTNNLEKYRKPPDAKQIADSCIFAF